MVLQQFFIFVEQRLAFGGVDEEIRYLRAELHRGGEARTTRTYDS